MNLRIISLRLSEIKVDFSLSSRMAFFDGKIAPISGIDTGAIRSRFVAFLSKGGTLGVRLTLCSTVTLCCVGRCQIGCQNR